VADADFALVEDRAQRFARGLSFEPLLVAARLELGRVDVAKSPRVVTSRPGQRLTRASNVSPSMTRSTSAG
jgi:hypothetical protein